MTSVFCSVSKAYVTSTMLSIERRHYDVHVSFGDVSYYVSYDVRNAHWRVMKTFKFSLMLRTRTNIDVFITLDENIYGIHNKRVNILYLLSKKGLIN